jgi:hypothetical protein
VQAETHLGQWSLVHHPAVSALVYLWLLSVLSTGFPNALLKVRFQEKVHQDLAGSPPAYLHLGPAAPVSKWLPSESRTHLLVSSQISSDPICGTRRLERAREGVRTPQSPTVEETLMDEDHWKIK